MIAKGTTVGTKDEMGPLKLRIESHESISIVEGHGL